MVWGCMTSRGFGCLVQVEGNMDAVQYCQILEEGLLGTLDDHDIDCNSVYFQQDNDPKHASYHAKAWLAKNRFHVLQWPANSPDLNPIENAWHQLDVNYNHQAHRARNEDELFGILQEEWQKLSLEYCNKLYESMPHWVIKIMSNKDKWAGY